MTAFGNFFQFQADFLSGTATDTRIDFIKNQSVNVVFIGKNVISVVSSRHGGNYDILIAVPVYVNNSYVRYALFIRATGEELISYFKRYNLYDDELLSSFSFLLYNMYDVVHISDKTKNRLIPQYVGDHIVNHNKATYYVQRSGKMRSINLNVDSLHIFEDDNFPKHYMSVIRLPYDGWSFIYMIPSSELDSRIKAIMTMFGFLIIGTLVILTVLLVYYEYTVEYNRKKIYDMGYYDEFTGLPNRANLRSGYPDKYTSLYSHMLDKYYMVNIVISNFHMLHNLYGTEITNKFELKLAESMRKMTSFVFEAYRGNNSFYAIIRADSEAEITIVLRKLFASAQSIVEVDYNSQFKAGVCKFSSSHFPENVDDIMDKCSIALYDHGSDNNKTKNAIIFFNVSMQEEIVRQNNLEKELVPAIFNGELLVYLQPKYSLENNRLAGAEALIRWNYKHQSMMPPGQFVPVFERNGSIAHIDNFIFISILKLLKHWNKLGYRMVPISVNFSQVQFRNPNLLRDLRERIKGYEEIIQYIDIEITESATIDSQDTVLEILNELKTMGFKLSMDDFGTGYSCLSNISLYPFDTIKLDKSFVDKIDVNNTSSPDVMLVNDVIQITKHFGIHSLVEGVENKAQKDILRNLGCEYCQGYYYSKAISVDDFETLLKEDKVFDDWE